MWQLPRGERAYGLRRKEADGWLVAWRVGPCLHRTEQPGGRGVSLELLSSVAFSVAGVASSWSTARLAGNDEPYSRI
jgi:hypothetical protein